MIQYVVLGTMPANLKKSRKLKLEKHSHTCSTLHCFGFASLKILSSLFNFVNIFSNNLSFDLGIVFSKSGHPLKLKILRQTIFILGNGENILSSLIFWNKFCKNSANLCLSRQDNNTNVILQLRNFLLKSWSFVLAKFLHASSIFSVFILCNAVTNLKLPLHFSYEDWPFFKLRDK